MEVVLTWRGQIARVESYPVGRGVLGWDRALQIGAVSIRGPWNWVARKR